MKYVLVTGGVVSGLGKGVTASSMGVLLQARGLRVTSIKIGEVAASGFWRLYCGMVAARWHAATTCTLCTVSWL